jgi:CheY-like chemotaxis protein
LLEKLGFAIRIAENGKEAERLFQQCHPHFIWMYQRMPVMDGLSATRRIRNLPEDLLENLSSAIVTLDVEHTLEAIRHIKTIDSVLAAALHRLIDIFDFRALQRLLQQNNG